MALMVRTFLFDGTKIFSSPIGEIEMIADQNANLIKMIAIWPVRGKANISQ
jgi:hypothetical protein